MPTRSKSPGSLPVWLTAPLRVVEVADDLFAPGVELGAFGGHRRTAGGVVEQPDRKFFLETGQRGADRSSRHAQLARRAAQGAGVDHIQKHHDAVQVFQEG